MLNLRALALPNEVERCLLAAWCEKLMEIGARIVRLGRYAEFQFADVAVPRTLSEKIPSRIAWRRLWPAPLPAC
jgi:hypothetical protein